MKTMSTVEMQIAARAKKFPDEALTNLHQYIDESLLIESFGRLNKKGSPGVDYESWYDYERTKMERIPQLLAGFKGGTYRAPHIKRVYIPKGGGKLRPLGIPTIEDKVLQTAVSRVLMPVYEEEFHDCSYGYRPGRSPHDAIDALFKEVSFGGKRYIIDADLQNYFGSINHNRLREFLDLRIKDGVVRKMIDKWLKAGIMEDGQLTYSREGTPQGGSCSPLLSNIYLHYVLDDWFIEQIQPLLKGKSFLIRFADDFVMGFTHKEDAERVLAVLPKRLGKYNLTLHPEKTRLIHLGEEEKGGNRHESSCFDFLGFTHFMGISLKGKQVLMRKTSKKKYRSALIRMNTWLRKNRHQHTCTLIDALNQKLRGYYGYYGITFNSKRLAGYYFRVKRLLHYWLNRRGGKRVWDWERYVKLITVWKPLLSPRICHSSVR